MIYYFNIENVLYSFRILMNFARKVPFAIFAVATLTCLFAQIDQSFSRPLEEECFEGVLPSDGPNANLPQQMLGGSGVPLQERPSSTEKSLPNTQNPTPQLTTNNSGETSLEWKPNICSKRLLQSSVTTNNKFILGCSVVFTALLLITRNLILVGMVTNTVDLFLPVVLLGECFLMVGLWTCQKHYLAVLYGKVFGSYWDGFNAVRLIIQPTVDAGTLPQLSQYGFSPLIIFNLSGEIAVAILLLIFTVLSRICAALFRHERLRRMTACLRPVWNGYFFAILPRVATFTGLHWRLVNVGAGFDGLNGTVCGLLSGAMLFYFVALLVQTRRANSKVERLEEGVAGIGLMRRIDLRRDFQFDCLRYSAIYFPCMNCLRVLGYCLPIGLFWDYYYISYGGAIMAQLGILMAEVSSTGYLLRRDKVLFPLQNFLLVVVHLSIITIALAESVQHSEVSQIAETVLFSVFGFVFGSAMIGVGMDAWTEVRVRCSGTDEGGSEDQVDGQSAQNFTRQLGKSSTVCQAKRNEDLDEEQSSNPDEVFVDTNASFKHSEKPLKLKIKKVRKGKII